MSSLPVVAELRDRVMLWHGAGGGSAQKLVRELTFCRNPIVGKEFPVECHHDTIAGGVRFLLQVDTEVDGAHDPVAELLMNERLKRPAVHLQGLVEAVDGGVGRHGG